MALNGPDVSGGAVTVVIVDVTKIISCCQLSPSSDLVITIIMSVSQSVVHSLCGVSSLFISFRDKNFPLIADIFIRVSMSLSF